MLKIVETKQANIHLSSMKSLSSTLHQCVVQKKIHYFAADPDLFYSVANFRSMYTHVRMTKNEIDAISHGRNIPTKAILAGTKGSPFQTFAN